MLHVFQRATLKNWEEPGDEVASSPGSLGGGGKRAWKQLHAHAPILPTKHGKRDTSSGYLAYHVLLVGLVHAHAVVSRLSFPLPQESLAGDEARGRG